MKVTSTSAQAGQRIKALIVGESGAGKTTLAGTLDGKTLFLGAENGELALAGKDIPMISLSQDDNGKVIEDPTARIKRLSDIFTWLRASNPYQNIFLDSLTEINELVVASLNKEFPDRKDSLVLWGENSKRMRSIIKGFRDLDCNVYMSCLSKIEKDENGQRFMGLSLSGKIAEIAPQYFDLVLFLQADAEGKRSIITTRTTKILAKDRSGKLAPVEPADLGAIARKITVVKKETK